MESWVEIVRSRDWTRTSWMHKWTFVGAANGLTSWARQTDDQGGEHLSLVLCSFFLSYSFSHSQKLCNPSVSFCSIFSQTFDKLINCFFISIVCNHRLGSQQSVTSRKSFGDGIGLWLVVLCDLLCSRWQPMIAITDLNGVPKFHHSKAAVLSQHRNQVDSTNGHGT